MYGNSCLGQHKSTRESPGAVQRRELLCITPHACHPLNSLHPNPCLGRHKWTREPCLGQRETTREHTIVRPHPFRNISSTSSLTLPGAVLFRMRAPRPSARAYVPVPAPTRAHGIPRSSRGTRTRAFTARAYRAYARRSSRTRTACDTRAFTVRLPISARTGNPTVAPSTKPAVKSSVRPVTARYRPVGR